jgi:hypothetical protein
MCSVSFRGVVLLSVLAVVVPVAFVFANIGIAFASADGIDELFLGGNRTLPPDWDARGGAGTAPLPERLTAVDVTSGAICRDVFGTCEWYACVERHLKCAQPVAAAPAARRLSYFGDVATHYCGKFQLLADRRGADRAPADLAAWIGKTRECLQVEMHAVLAALAAPVAAAYPAPAPTAVCAALHEEGLHSHSKCYVAAGICEMLWTRSMYDTVRVGASMFVGHWQYSAWVQVYETWSTCLRRDGWPL